ncbi:hypothetical protein CCP3SC1_220039 [Gammaproteobacteria bacterium]
MTPLALVTHSSPGRLRLKVPSVRGEEEWFLAAQTQLATCAEVREVEVNSHTASILVHHNGNADVVFNWAQTQGLFEMEDPSKGPPASVAATVRQGLNRFDNMLAAVSNGALLTCALVRGLQLNSILDGFFFKKFSDFLWRFF